MQLTPSQIQQFHTDGFLVLRHFLEPERCDEILALAKRHLHDKIEPLETETGYHTQSKEGRIGEKDYSSHAQPGTQTVRRLRQVYDREPAFKAWMENEKIRPILQQLLGGQVVLTMAHHNSIMTKLAGEGSATSWHQDRRYWSYSDNNLLSVWLALEDETSENGALEFIPKSHTMTFLPEHFNEKEYLSETHKDNQKIIAKRVETTLQKGDVVLFHALLLHRANRNSSKKDKLSFVYTVKGNSTKALEGSRSAAFAEIPLPLI